MGLNWKETKDGVELLRNITMEFSRNETSQKYGVSRISAVYDVKQYVEVENQTDPVTNETIPVNVTVIQYVSMTTFRMEPMEFLVPLNRSYLCMDAGSKMMHTELHKTSEKPGAELSAKMVQLDAFRSGSAPEG